MGMIQVGNVIVATSADVLSGTRLSSMPRGGNLTIEFACGFAVAGANAAAQSYWQASFQSPEGDNPIDGVIVPADVAATGGIVGASDGNDVNAYPAIQLGPNATRLQFQAQQGTRATLDFTKVGSLALANSLIWRATLVF